MNSKLTGRLFWVLLLIALSVVISACADAETPVASDALIAPTSTPAFWPPGMPPPTARPAAVKPSVAYNRTECQSRGAKWYEEPVFGPNCQNYPTLDGGQACGSSSECEAAWCDANLTAERADEILEQAGGKPVFMTGTCPRITHEVWCRRRTSVEGGRLTITDYGCE